MRPRYLLLLVVLVAGVPWLAGAASAQEAEYVGADMCMECHEGYQESLAKTQHGKAGFAELSNNGCETCHGPGSLHLEDPDTYKPRITDKSPAEQNAVCQSCHDGGDQFFWAGSKHESRDLTCTSCHGVHEWKSETAQLKTATAKEQCYSCHKDVRAETYKRSHHPIREGQITCRDCHNAHGAQSDKMVNAASINEQCYSCHAEKRGPFLWDHAPVREACTTCHTPHGSNHLKLQKTSVPYICQQCHMNTRHPGSLYEAQTTPSGSQASNRFFNRSCLNCHSAIHGSNHPSGWALYR